MERSVVGGDPGVTEKLRLEQAHLAGASNGSGAPLRMLLIEDAAVMAFDRVEGHESHRGDFLVGRTLGPRAARWPPAAATDSNSAMGWPSSRKRRMKPPDSAAASATDLCTRAISFPTRGRKKYFTVCPGSRYADGADSIIARRIALHQ